MDEADWYVTARDEEVFRWTSESRDLTPEAARRSFEHFADVPGVYGFAIVDAATDQLIGHLPASVDGDTAEVAYWLAAEKRRHGILGEALDLVLEWLPKIEVRRAVLELHPDNLASRRAAERAGFIEVGDRPSSKSYADTGRVMAFERAVVGLSDS